MCFVNLNAINWNADVLARLSDEHWEIDAYVALGAEQDAALAVGRRGMRRPEAGPATRGRIQRSAQ
jgi:hypothetical protein